MTDIRQRLRILADNAQRSEIVEDAIRLIDRLEGKVNMDLPIKVLSRDEVLMGAVKLKWTRVQVENEIEKFSKCHSGNETALYIGWREILRRMDEFKAPKKKSWDLGCVGGQSSDVEPQRKKPEPNKQVPEETISSPSHQQWLRERKKQDSLNPQPIEEPEPKWEPGTMLRGCSEIYRLDVFSKLGGDKQSEIWDFTDMHTGESLTGGAFPYLLYEIYRLPHEFKVGDWFEYRCSGGGYRGPFQVKSVGQWGRFRGKNELTFDGPDDYKDDAVCSILCRHAPPPKEPSRKQALGDLARQEQAEGKYRCDLPYEKEVMPSEHRSMRHSGKSDSTNSAVTGAHRAGKTSERFSGPHWYALDLAIAQYEKSKSPEVSILMYPLLRERDLRDAWLDKDGEG